MMHDYYQEQPLVNSTEPSKLSRLMRSQHHTLNPADISLAAHDYQDEPVNIRVIVPVRSDRACISPLLKEKKKQI